MKRWPAVRAVDWTMYPGAYGTDRDVATALETLRAANPESDDFQDAWNDVMLGHVWHQGNVYPVTPIALGFFLELPARRRRTGELAEYAAVIASAAVRAADRNVGDAILSVLVAYADALDPATLAAVPALAGRASLVDVLRAAATACPDALRAAAAELAASPHPVKLAASAKISEALARGEMGDRLPGALAALADALEDPDRLRERFGLGRELPAALPGETSARVTIAEDNWFVAQVHGRNVTVRWPGHPFREEDTATLIDLDDHNRPRQVRHPGGALASFDTSGKRRDV